MQPQLLARVVGWREEAVAADGFLAGCVGPAKGEGQASGTSRASRRAAGHVYRDECVHVRESGRMLEGDAASHRVSDQCDWRSTQMLEERLEILGECADPGLFGIVGVAMAAKVQSHHVESFRDRRCNVIPPVGVRTPSVQEYDQRVPRITPVQRVESHAVEGRSGESLAARRHGFADRSSRDRAREAVKHRFSAGSVFRLWEKCRIRPLQPVLRHFSL